MGAALIKQWHTERIQADLPPVQALRAYCLQHDLAAELEDIVATPARRAFGHPIVKGRRVYARYPHFRDEAGIPDSCFEITARIRVEQRVTKAAVVGEELRIRGEAYLSYLGGSTTIVLRRRPWGRELRFPTDPVPTPHLRNRDVEYRQAGFASSIDLRTADGGRPLGRGSWEISLLVGPDQVRREAPLRLPKNLRTKLRRQPAPPDAAAALHLPKRGRLRLRVGPVDPAARWLERVDGILRRVRRTRRRVVRTTKQAVRARARKRP
jgi:hypothetical protein